MTGLLRQLGSRAGRSWPVLQTSGAVCFRGASHLRRFSSSLETDGHVSQAPQDLGPWSPVSMGEVRKLLWEFTDETVKDFCRISGDYNPIHWDYQAARLAGYENPIVPGMQCAALFPAIIGTEFPGSVYMSQTLRFRAPVLVGEPIAATVEVLVCLPHRHRYKVTFATKCTRTRDDVLAVDGIAVAIIPGEKDSIPDGAQATGKIV